VLLFELLTGRAPFAAPSAQAVVEAIRRRQIVFPDHLSPLAVGFLSALLQRDPEQRWTARQLLSHPWVQQHCGAPGEGGPAAAPPQGADAAAAAPPSGPPAAAPPQAWAAAGAASGGGGDAGVQAAVEDLQLQLQ
jgi:hypothetical protein